MDYESRSDLKIFYVNYENELMEKSSKNTYCINEKSFQKIILKRSYMIFLTLLKLRYRMEVRKTFGAVYCPGDEYAQVISNAYSRFLNENAFDPQLFKSLLAMEKYR